MPRYRYPSNRPPAAVHVSRAENVPVSADGEFEAPEAVARRIAAARDTTVEAMRVSETCDVVKSDGEVCGRERPCPYHDGGDD